MTLVAPFTTLDPARLQGATPLPQLGVIRAQGEDAAKFLHGQLTQDFSLLGLSEARLAGFCSAKGRMLASFVGFKRAHDDILLVCSRDVLTATLKRLSMFVLRAKVKLVDASDAFQIWGLAGGAAPPGGAQKPWSLTGGPDDGQTVQLYPGAGVARALWVGPAEQPAPAGERLPEILWAWLEGQSGGGPSQFRGTLKRRAYLVHGDGPLQVGQEVFHDSDASQPCGTVAAAAPHPEAGWDAIVSDRKSVV